MPPKALARPAAAVPGIGGGRGGRRVLRARGKAKAFQKPAAKLKAAGKAKAKAEAGGGDSGRGRRREEEKLGDKEVSEAFAKGVEVEPKLLGVQEWRPGQKLAITRGLYWEEAVSVAGILKSIKIEADGTVLIVDLEGSQAEALVKWKGLHPGRLLELHLCPPDCARMSKEGLVHAQRLKLVTAENKEDWMDNLIETRRERET